MNKQPKVTRREQQEFIRDEAIRMLHYALRVCPCDGVGCKNCNGKMKYFDTPVPIYGIITSGMNSKKKEAQTPTVRKGFYKLLVEGRFRISEGDRLIPFGTREFEGIDEILYTSDPKLTFIPINPWNVQISFLASNELNPNQANYGIVNYRYPNDFTIDRENYGQVTLFSKSIKWITSPPSDQEKFSVRYQYYPDFVVEEIPPAKMSQSQRLIQELPLKKITIGGEEKEKSFEKSSDAIRGLKYE